MFAPRTKNYRITMNQKKLLLNGKNLSIEDIYNFTKNPKTEVEVSADSIRAIKSANKFLNENARSKVIYGVNTGFGPMASHILGSGQLINLQYNLIRSHATGMGKPIKNEYVQAAMIVRLNTLAKGYSGVSPELIEHLSKFINHRIIPIVPEHGAVGTSGDLVQLAHIALALIGEGKVFYDGKIRATKDVLRKLKIKPYALKPKEGLSLINGTSVMSGIAALLCKDAETILDVAISSGCLSLELVHGFSDGFSKELSAARPHSGQVKVAERMREILKGSKLLRNRHAFQAEQKIENHLRVIPEAVQEFYSLRCIPQILGPVYDTLAYAKEHVSIEINSATDNPLVDVKGKTFLHGGNFHGDYIAAVVDQLKMTIIKLTMLSERRSNFFLNYNINKFFPPFMNLKRPGLTLGLQALQFICTSTTAKSQTLAFPQYVHSISTNADNQDVVSMGTDAALIFSEVIENAFVVLTAEMVVLTQAVDYMKIEKELVANSKKIYSRLRAITPAIIDDRSLREELVQLTELVRNNFN